MSWKGVLLRRVPHQGSSASAMACLVKSRRPAFLAVTRVHAVEQTFERTEPATTGMDAKTGGHGLEAAGRRTAAWAACQRKAMTWFVFRKRVPRRVQSDGQHPHRKRQPGIEVAEEQDRHGRSVARSNACIACVTRLSTLIREGLPAAIVAGRNAEDCIVRCHHAAWPGTSSATTATMKRSRTAPGVATSSGPASVPTAGPPSRPRPPCPPAGFRPPRVP